MKKPPLEVHSQVDDLYREHHRWLRGWLQPKINCGHLATDMVQDVFVRILTADNAAERLEAVREPRGYLATIARRLMIDHFRRARLERAWMQTLAEQPQAEDISEEERAILLETLYELDAMLAGLGRDVRRTFLLAQLDGMPYKQIADQLGVSLSSVNRYIAKALHHCVLFNLRADLR